MCSFDEKEVPRQNLAVGNNSARQMYAGLLPILL